MVRPTREDDDREAWGPQVSHTGGGGGGEGERGTQANTRTKEMADRAGPRSSEKVRDE
jgi:hypothetical protein